MKVKLKNREIILIFILTLLLIFYLYISYIRSDLEETINNINYEISEQEILINSMNLAENENLDISHSKYYEEIFSNFHLSDQLITDLNLISEKHLSIQRINLNDTEIYEREILYNLSSTGSGILKLLEENINNRSLKSLIIKKIDQDNFDVFISLSKYTLEKIPHSGVVRNYNYEEEIKNLNNKDLNIEIVEDSNSSSKEKNNSNQSNNSHESTKKSTSNNENKLKSLPKSSAKSHGNIVKTNKKIDNSKGKNTSLNKENISNKQVVKDEMYSETKIEEVQVDENELYFNSLMNLINSDYIIDGSIIDLSFFLENKDQLISSGHINYFIVEEGKAVISFANEVDFEKNPIIFTDSDCIYSIDYKTTGDDKLDLVFEDIKGNIYLIDLKGTNSSWRTYILQFPIEKDLFPVKLVRAKTKGNGYIRDIVYYEK